jgi:predicted DNA-binding protein YlxM (UPF0122 family)
MRNYTENEFNYIKDYYHDNVSREELFKMYMNQLSRSAITMLIKDIHEDKVEQENENADYDEFKGLFNREDMYDE